MSEIVKRLEDGYYGWRKWEIIQEWKTPTGEMGLYRPKEKGGIAGEALISVYFADGKIVIHAHHIANLNVVQHDLELIAKIAGALSL